LWRKHGSFFANYWVYDAASGAEVARLALDGRWSAELTADGRSLIVWDDGDRIEDTTIMCYDVPPHGPLRYALGVPVGLVAVVVAFRVGWRRWRRRPTATAAPQGVAQCS
jgi:hypothetical protein